MGNQMQILLIEDHKDAAADLVQGLWERDDCADHAVDGARGSGYRLNE
jgi:hypothetical protein